MVARRFFIHEAAKILHLADACIQNRDWNASSGVDRTSQESKLLSTWRCAYLVTYCADPTVAMCHVTLVAGHGYVVAQRSDIY